MLNIRLTTTAFGSWQIHGWRSNHTSEASV